jgi:hypothetical protein
MVSRLVAGACFAALATFVLLFSSIASADQIVTYDLSGVTFNDGGTATGSFTVDIAPPASTTSDATGTITSADIVTTPDPALDIAGTTYTAVGSLALFNRQPFSTNPFPATAFFQFIAADPLAANGQIGLELNVSPFNPSSSINPINGGTQENVGGTLNYRNTFGGALTLAGAVVQPTPPPSVLTLANLANNVYSGAAGYADPVNNQVYAAITLPGGAIANSCNILGQAACAYSGFQAVAYASPDGSQVVVAVEGTNLNCDTETLACIKTVAADGSFKGTTPSADLVTTVGYAAQFVQDVERLYPGANITVTGHSLGGAVAQVIGQAFGLTTDAFNAPGAGGALYTALCQQVGALGGCQGGASPDYSNTNYRIFGDQVSLAGIPIGNTVTLPAPPSATYSPSTRNPNLSLAQTIGDNLAAIIQSHSMETVLNQIQNLANGSIQPVQNCSSAPCAGEPDVVSALEDTILPVLTASAAASKVIYSFLALIPGSGVGTDGGILIDPPDTGTDFVLTESPSSPFFSSIILPGLSGVGMYDLSYETGAAWSPFFLLQPGIEYVFGSDVDGIEFDPFDSSGQPVTLPDAFLFDVSFDSTGEFSGTLTVTQSAQVPEPSALCLMLTGIALAGMFRWASSRHGDR